MDMRSRSEGMQCMRPLRYEGTPDTNLRKTQKHAWHEVNWPTASKDSNSFKMKEKVVIIKGLRFNQM